MKLEDIDEDYDPQLDSESDGDNGDDLPEIVVANHGQDRARIEKEGPPLSTIFWASADGYDPQRRQDLPTLGALTV